MDLRNRSGRKGGAEFGVERGDRLAEPGLDRPDRQSMVEGRHSVLQTRQAAREPLADHVAARCHDLTEFHIGWAERLERPCQTLAGIVGAVAARHQANTARAHTGESGQLLLILRRQDRVMTRQRHGGAGQAGKMGERGEHRGRV